MGAVVCPVCFCDLNRENGSYKCENNHCFDISKFGTLNLNMSNSSSKKRHGDDSAMVRARKAFLDNDYYGDLLKDICKKAQAHKKNCDVLVDIGCGEGYYTSGVAECVSASEVVGIDISRDAVRYFKKRLPDAFGCIASAYKLPIKSESADIIMNMFAPIETNECARVLKEKGILIRTYVMREHLIELKRAVYTSAYYNDEEDVALEGFEIIDSAVTNGKITVVGEDIQNLFMMTPYYYKTAREDQEKLKHIEKLDVTTQFRTVIYKKSRSC